MTSNNTSIPTLNIFQEVEMEHLLRLLLCIIKGDVDASSRFGFAVERRYQTSRWTGVRGWTYIAGKTLAMLTRLNLASVNTSTGEVYPTFAFLTFATVTLDDSVHAEDVPQIVNLGLSVNDLPSDWETPLEIAIEGDSENYWRSIEQSEQDAWEADYIRHEAAEGSAFPEDWEC